MDFCSRLLLVLDVGFLPSPCTYPQVENRRNKKQKQKKQTRSALKHRLLSPWLARVGHGAAGTMAGDASAGSGHLAPAWHELEASKERRAQDRSCWHAGKAPACPVHLVAPLGVRDVRFHLQGEKQSRVLGCTPGSTERPFQSPPGPGFGKAGSWGKAAGPRLTVSSVSVLSSALSMARRCPSPPVPSLPWEPSPTGDGDAAPASALFFSLSLHPAGTGTAGAGCARAEQQPRAHRAGGKAPWHQKG